MALAHVVEIFDEPLNLGARPIRNFVLSALLGVFFLIVNFPHFLLRTIAVNVSNGTLRSVLDAPVYAVQSALSGLIGEAPTVFFQRVMTCSFFLLWVFLGLLALYSARRRSVRFLAYGVGGLVTGYLAVHLLSWAAVAIVVVVGGAFFVVGWVISAIYAIVAFVAHYTWPLFVLAAFIAAAWIAYRHRAALLEWLRRLASYLGKRILYIAGLIVGAAMLAVLVPAFYRYVIVPIMDFLSSILSPIWHVILFLFKWAIIIIISILIVLAAVAVCLVALAFLGSLLVSQLQAGWRAARSTGEVMVAGFAIGSALALIILTCVATPSLDIAINQAWIGGLLGLGGSGPTHIVTGGFLVMLPDTVKSFVFTYLTNFHAPAFDGFIFLAVVGLSTLSVLTRLFSPAPIADEHPPFPYIAREYGKIVVGVFIGLLVLFLSGQSGDSSA